MGNQEFGKDVIVDLAQRDPKIAKSDDGYFLSGVLGIHDINISRISVGRDGNTSMKIETVIQGDGVSNSGE